MDTEAFRKLGGIDFHDGQPIGIAWNGSTLLLDYGNWQEQVLRLKFTGVASVVGYGGSASLCDARATCDSDEIEQTRQRLSVDWVSGSSWQASKLTQIVILDDVPLLTVVFENVEIELLGDDSDTIERSFSEFNDSQM